MILCFSLTLHIFFFMHMVNLKKFSFILRPILFFSYTYSSILLLPLFRSLLLSRLLTLLLLISLSHLKSPPYPSLLLLLRLFPFWFPVPFLLPLSFHPLSLTLHPVHQPLTLVYSYSYSPDPHSLPCPILLHTLPLFPYSSLPSPPPLSLSPPPFPPPPLFLFPSLFPHPPLPPPCPPTSLFLSPAPLLPLISLSLLTPPYRIPLPYSPPPSSLNPLPRAPFSPPLARRTLFRAMTRLIMHIHPLDDSRAGLCCQEPGVRRARHHGCHKSAFLTLRPLGGCSCDGRSWCLCLLSLFVVFVYCLCLLSLCSVFVYCLCLCLLSLFVAWTNDWYHAPVVNVVIDCISVTILWQRDR